MGFVIKRRILNIVAIVFAITMLFFYKFLTETAIGITILISFLAIYFVLTLLWWRCPHCNSYLWKLVPFATHCPYCGNEFE